jgi:hypothetical protein
MDAAAMSDRTQNLVVRARDTGRPIFIAKFRAEPGVADPIKALRAMLKAALRRFGLRCVSIVEDKQGDD